MLNPDALPSSAWKKRIYHFTAADGKSFQTTMVSKQKVGIQFFPDCIVWIHVIGSYLFGRDLLVGFDTYHAAEKLQILPTELKYKREFLPYTQNPNQFSIAEVPLDFAHLKELFIPCCADSHRNFYHPSPLYKNPDFFITLPFKLNEDVNPTRASHPGMSPSDLALARQECQELLQQGLIEPIRSPWACQAFYVEKRSEKIRGKKRLLGIHPEERYKTAFCIPDAQYQWTVMPFGLKTAPSIFQKAMVRIFESILDTCIIYIDDILLFSKSAKEHDDLLRRFHSLVHSYGIMLSERKSYIGQTEVDFLGLKLKNGQYEAGSHLAQELRHFPSENLSKK
eukprot:XP_015584293.1 uncharacterized protein LOC107262618 [Ricinus communis]